MDVTMHTDALIVAIVTKAGYLKNEIHVVGQI